MAMEEEVAEPSSGWRLFFDRAINYKGSGISAVIISKTGQHYLMDAKLNFRYNGANLNSHLMKDICEQFKITHRNSIAYRPQMNEAVEAANKNIKRILRKLIDNYKNWHNQLPYALLWYRTTTRTSIGATPYLLLYGIEAVIPAEVEILSLRIIQEAQLTDAEWVRNRYEQLAMIDEKRMVADSEHVINWLTHSKGESKLS
ncbi:uncharacterized protein LOC132619795 [Lycium barbarum]|uniref:uncharacterized protein LOC132619795 n=1 Tax=Lycium barbarum TaxID=112863 RepID=UPI00293E6DBC|nr:uncharacterized protein LOC132619795 [Lycium barbarum]